MIVQERTLFEYKDVFKLLSTYGLQKNKEFFMILPLNLSFTEQFSIQGMCFKLQVYLPNLSLSLNKILTYLTAITIDPGTTNDKHNPGPNSPQQSFHIRLPKHLTTVSSGTNRTNSQTSAQTPQSLRYGNMGCQVSRVGIQN